MTMAGTVMGTPHYMSPEQLTGSPLDGRSDLFALGAILFELLVGKAAFPGATSPRCSTPSCTSHCRRSMDRRRWPPSTGSCIRQLARSRRTATPSPPPWRRSFVPPGI